MLSRLDSWLYPCVVVVAIFALPLLASRPANAVLRQHHSDRRAVERSASEIHHAVRPRHVRSRMVQNAGHAIHVRIGHRHYLAKPSKIASSDKPLIVIDPGHGGRDGGAVGRSGTLEKN